MGGGPVGLLWEGFPVAREGIVPDRVRFLKGIPKLKTNFLPQNHQTNIRLMVFAEFFFDQFFTHF